jgi:hypothetical protein
MRTVRVDAGFAVAACEGAIFPADSILARFLITLFGNENRLGSKTTGSVDRNFEQ